MAPELAQNGANSVPKSMKNGFQEARNKKDEKWSEKKSCEGARGCEVVRNPGGG